MRIHRSRFGRLSLPLLIILAAVAVAGCGGGGGDDAASTSASAATGTTTTTPSGSRHHGTRRTEGTEASAPAAPKASSGRSTHRHPGARDHDAAGTKVGRRKVAVAPLEVSGGGSSRFKVEGGDNSVQEYGEEAGGSELRDAAETVHAFLVARVRGEWARACSLLSARTAAGLEGLAASAPESQGAGCPAALAALTKQVSSELARRLTTVDAASLRREGGQAFLIYTAPPGRTVYAMPLTREEGAWRLGAVEAAALPGATAPGGPS